MNHDERVESFFSKFTEQHYKKGDTLIWGGSEPEGVCYLKEGHVRQYTISEHTGNILTLHIYHPKSFFPMIWAMANKPNTYFFEAISPVVVYRAPKEDVLEFLRHDAEILYHFSARLLSGLNGMLTRLEIISFTDVYGRVISELLYLAKHFGSPHEAGLVLPHFTHQEIAEFVGAARETTSVAIEKLEKSHLIIYMGHNIYIPDQEKLLKELKKKRRHK